MRHCLVRVYLAYVNRGQKTCQWWLASFSEQGILDCIKSREKELNISMHACVHCSLFFIIDLM